MYQLFNDDCLNVMPTLSDHSIDLILCDLPYGSTACAWDTVLPLKELWEQYGRLIRPNGAIVLTASQPFTTVLIHSKMDWFKYEWIWVKNRPTGFPHAKNKPMKKHENILVFSEGTTVHASQSSNRMPYYPQGLSSIPPTRRSRSSQSTSDAFFSKRKSHTDLYHRTETGYPNSILTFSNPQLGIHPTAKPVDLMAYLIETYSEPGWTVMDNTMGSGTTGVAAIQTGRDFIGIEKDPKYFVIAEERIAAAASTPSD